MNWDAIGAIGEIVGAIAVVATLGYLAVQTRYARQSMDANTKAIRSAARIESGRYWSEEGIQLAVSPDMAGILARGLENAQDLDDEERERLIAWFVQHVVATDALYLQYADGSLPEDAWAAHETTLIGMVQYDAFTRIWDAGFVPASPKFRDYLNSLRSENRSTDWTFHAKARIYD
jgi:hypothetical protein